MSKEELVELIGLLKKLNTEANYFETTDSIDQIVSIAKEAIADNVISGIWDEGIAPNKEN